VAFRVDRREDVDRFRAEFLAPRGLGTLYGTPREFPEYRPGYYAVFFEDPDRLKVEVVHIPTAPPA
jgi:catechol 2,3-dioxygenase-like lactoylglutathione lyase family enzyme